MAKRTKPQSPRTAESEILTELPVKLDRDIPQNFAKTPESGDKFEFEKSIAKSEGKETAEKATHESLADDEENTLERTISAIRQKLKFSKKRPTKVPIVRDALTIEVEKILSEGLQDIYKELDTLEQQEFKIKGEETAIKVRYALQKTRVKIKEVFQLVFEWLKMLPGVNHFFLEQEAKIKADKILALHRLQEKSRSVIKNNP